MKIRSFIPFGLATASLVFAACNAGPLLQTGSLSAATPVAAPATPKIASPVDRALHMGATSARAQKCGFYFDAAALRTNFLAAEAARGTPADGLAKTGQSFDFTTRSVASKITDSESYCTKDRTAVIKAALQKALAGDYEPPVETAANSGSNGALSWLEGDAKSNKFNPNEIYDPLLNEPGKSKSDE